MKLENFKSWQSLDIEMTPLTILFGTNSSGKSSVLQAILWIPHSFEKTGRARIDFGGNPNDYIDLGSYQDVIFSHDISRKLAISMGFAKNTNESIELQFTLAYTDDDVLLSAKEFTHPTNSIKIYEENRVQSLEDWFRWLNIGDLRIHYLGPLRQRAQRSYLWSGTVPSRILPDGENTIAALVESTRRDGKLVENVAEWLVKLELVKSFRVNPLDEGKRFYEPLVDIAGVETALLDTGFGVSQVLPVITTLFFVPEGSIVLLEQPELHLHPRAQAHLADLMLHVAEKRKLQLIVESHSEHLLRRLQRRIAEEEQVFASPENVRMYFCDAGDNGSTIQAVEVDIYGQINNWPDKFFGDITGDLEAMTMAALQRSMNGKN